jgi:hypothetical protein
VFYDNFKCLYHLIFEPNSIELNNVCQHVCRPHSGPIVYQLSDIHKFVVTNVQNITIRCLNVLTSGSPALDVNYNLLAGAFLIQLTCFCSVLHKGQTIITAPFPCSLENSDMETTKIIPRSFVNLTGIDDFSSKAHLTTSNLSTVLKSHLNDTPFHFEFQVRNLTDYLLELRNDSIPELFNWQFEQINNYYFIAITMLYFLVSLLLYFTARCFVMQRAICSINRVNLIEHPDDKPLNVERPIVRKKGFFSRKPKRNTYRIEAHELVKLFQPQSSQLPVQQTQPGQPIASSSGYKLYPTLNA